MPRPHRSWHPDSFYHIGIRGNNRQSIFIDETDIFEYYRILEYVYSKFLFEVYSYCIMTNHAHFLLRSPHVHLGTLMARINKRYSDFYRKRHDYTGQIYENRYFSKEVVDPIGMLKVSSYIHRNPIETKIPMVSSLEYYPYSTYPDYYYNRKSAHRFVNLKLLPSLMPEEKQKTAYAYAEWCK